MNPHGTESEFSQEAAPFQRAAERVREGIAIINASGHIVFANDRLAQMLRLECAEVVGGRMVDFVAGVDRPRFAALLANPPDPLTREQFRLAGANPFPLPVEVAVERQSTQGNATAILIATDLSRRRRAEEQLAFHANLLANVTDAVVATDSGHSITYWNAAAERQYGWTADEVLGRPLQDVVRPVLSRDDLDRYRRELEETGRLHSEHIHHRKDGTPIVVEGWRVALRGADDRRTGYVAISRDVTERRQAEEEIRRLNRELEQHVAERTAELEAARKSLADERDTLQTILAGIAEEVWYCDTQGNTRQLNTAAVQGLGFEQEAEVPLDRLIAELEILKPDGTHRSMDENPLLQSLRGEVCRGEEIVKHRKTGQLRYRQFTTSPVRNYHGEIVGAVSVTRDITDRKHAEEKLREALQTSSAAEARLTTVLDQLPSGVTIRDAASGEIVMINEEARRILGRPVHTLQDASRYEGVHPDGRPLRVEEWPLTRALAHGEIVRDEEIELRGADASRVVLRVNAAPVRDPDGTVIAGVAVFNDITAEKRIQESLDEAMHALRESEEQLRVAAKAANIGAWNWKPQSGQVQVSANWKAVFGVPPETDVTFEVWQNALHPDDRESSVNALLHAAETHTEFNVEYRVVWPDGSVRWIVDRGRGTYDEHGQPVNFAGVNVDITARKQVEEALRASEERLQELNRDLEGRAAELALANRDLESFSYSVSHDLRTPLSAVRTFAEMLLQDGEPLPAEQRSYAELIRENVLAMEQLIQSLLAFSRSGRQPLLKQNVSQVELARQALTELYAAQVGRRIEFFFGDMPDAQGDPLLLKQVWINLLSNALKFTRHREVARIEIGSYQEGPETVYFVRDNGTGFDMNDADRLFGVFRRLHTDDEYEGNGIGLAIVERIVRRHGGRVWADAKLDDGARFAFTLG